MPIAEPTKKQLQDLIDDVGDQLENMLDPSLTREELIGLVQELESQVNGDEEEDEEQEEEQEEAA